MKQTTIAVIGVGHVGATIAYSLITKNLATHILLVDTDEKRCKSEQDDLQDALSHSQTQTVSSGTLSQAAQADIIIIAAGIPQKPNQPRSELLDTNKQVIESIARGLTNINPNAIIIVVSNPVDVLTYLMSTKKLVPDNQLFGAGTLLDSARLIGFIAEAMNVPRNAVTAYVLGEHGETQFPGWSLVTINNKPLSLSDISEKERTEIATKTRTRVYSIIEGKVFTYYGIANAVAAVCKAIIFDEHKLFPVSTYHSEQDAFMSTPCIIGKQGIELQLPITLEGTEKELFGKSAQAIRAMVAQCKK